MGAEVPGQDMEGIPFVFILCFPLIELIERRVTREHSCPCLRRAAQTLPLP